MSLKSPTQLNSSQAFNRDRSGILQRKCACGQRTIAGGQCSECQKKHLQHRTRHREGMPDVPPIVHKALNTSGRPLDRKTRTSMESRFNQDFSRVHAHTQQTPSAQAKLAIGAANHASEQEADRTAERIGQSVEISPSVESLLVPGYDFSRVRVHTDDLANQSAQAIDALAYTVDHNIVFRQGYYQPETVPGQQLLAHELTHVVQQGQASRNASWQNHMPTLQRKEQPAETAAANQFAGPLTEREWQLIEMWQSHGSVGFEPLTENADQNAQIVAGSIFCGRALLHLVSDESREDPLLCVDPDVTRADPRVQQLVQQVTARGPIINWAQVAPNQRMLHVMQLLVNTYNFPENGAAGLVGNLWSESGVLPNRVQGSDIRTPMRASNRAGRITDFTPEQIMNRDAAGQEGPRAPGIGLAQWTSADRREGLFQHTFAGRQQGTAILFNMDAQVDYLVTELQTKRQYRTVYNVITRAGVSLNDASDIVVYRFEVPGSVLDAAGNLLPQSDPAVQAVFARRRANSRRALRVFQAAQQP
ncbi:MAG: phage tail tip lysozyme [Cyanobacteria bacterium J06638_20]